MKLGVNFLALCALLSLSGSSLAAPSSATSGQVIKAPKIPSSWRHVGSARGSTPFSFTLHLNSANLAGLASRLDQNGALALSEAEVATYASPTNTTLATVQSYLKAQGIADSAISYNNFKDQITVKSTVAQASKLFSASLASYSNPDGTVLPRTTSYTIPSQISSSVSLVQPLASFFQITTGPGKGNLTTTATKRFELEERAATAPPDCVANRVVPACLRELYGTNTYTPTGGANTDILVGGFIGQSFSQADLTLFLQQFRPDAAGYVMPVIEANNAVNDPANPGDEATLDVQTVVAQTYPLKSVFYNYGTATDNGGDIFEAAFTDIINNYQAYGSPGVYSVSYGSDEGGFGATEAQVLCNSAMKLTAMGTTIVFSSGDNGVNGQGTNNGDSCPPFVPTYPSGCQYILSVGATVNFAPEVAVTAATAGYYGGGGFSNVFARPTFQNTAVSQYKTVLGTKDAGDYSTTGRGYPDISAQGYAYVITEKGNNYRVSGTSASCPTVASIFSLLNDARRAKGQKNLGWAHPFLYRTPTGLTDVTSGGSYGCADATLGFPAAKRWDPSSGLGTPYFPNLRTALGI